jgi:hypothetical protein
MKRMIFWIVQDKLGHHALETPKLRKRRRPLQSFKPESRFFNKLRRRTRTGRCPERSRKG